MFGTELVLKNDNVCSVDIVRCEMPDESDMILVPVVEVYRVQSHTQFYSMLLNFTQYYSILLNFSRLVNILAVNTITKFFILTNPFTTLIHVEKLLALKPTQELKSNMKLFLKMVVVTSVVKWFRKDMYNGIHWDKNIYVLTTLRFTGIYVYIHKIKIP